MWIVSRSRQRHMATEKFTNKGHLWTGFCIRYTWILQTELCFKVLHQSADAEPLLMMIGYKSGIYRTPKPLRTRRFYIHLFLWKASSCSSNVWVQIRLPSTILRSLLAIYHLFPPITRSTLMVIVVCVSSIEDLVVPYLLFRRKKVQINLAKIHIWQNHLYKFWLQRVTK